MPQSLNKSIQHIVFSTKYRLPLIDETIENHLFEYMGGILKGLDCLPFQVGGYKDHVHLLCLLSRKIAIMKLLEEVKKRSSRWIKTKGNCYNEFYWQDGYAIFSVDPRRLDKTVEYIKNQKIHHQNMSYQDECRHMFRKMRIEFDERYFWD